MEQSKKIVVENQEFILDYDGWKIFTFEFSNREYKIIINNGYLARKDKRNLIIEFHRFFLKKDIEKYAEENKLDEESLEVHHINGVKNDNRRNNLEVLTKEAHKKKHEDHLREKKERSWKKFQDKNRNVSEKILRKKFDIWYDRINLEGEEITESEEEIQEKEKPLNNTWDIDDQEPILKEMFWNKYKVCENNRLSKKECVEGAREYVENRAKVLGIKIINKD